MSTEHDTLVAEYLDAVGRHGPSASELLAAVRPGTVHTSYLGRSLSRPAFLTAAEVAGLAADLDTLRAALTSLPDRLFGGDTAAFARAVGTSAQQAEMIGRGRGTAPPRLARADLYRDRAGFRLLEVNWGAALGGLDSASLNVAMLDQPSVAAFAAARGLVFTDPMVAMIETLLAAHPVAPGRRPMVAVTDWPESFRELEPQLRRSAAALAPFGIDAVACHLGQLSHRDGRVWVDDRPVDVVYRLFLVEDLLAAEGPALIEPVLRAAERGEVTVFAPMDAELYGSKGALAMLSDEARPLLDPADRAVLDRLLPWTRMVRPGPVGVAGTSVDLLAHALAERHELILKPTLLHGGAGVTPGWSTPAAEWRERVEAAMDGPFVLQRRVHPLPEAFPTDDGTEDWTLIWGVFLAVRGFGGAWVRGAPSSEAAVVGMLTGAATCCFHEPPRS